MGIVYRPPAGGGGGGADAPLSFTLTEINSVQIALSWLDALDGVSYDVQHSLDNVTWTHQEYVLQGVGTTTLTVPVGLNYFRIRTLTIDDISPFVVDNITTVAPTVPEAGQIVFLESGNYNGSSWPDSSINGRNFVSGNGSTSPALISSWRNGENAARITASGQYLKNEAMPSGIFESTGGRCTLGFVFERGPGAEIYLWQCGQAAWDNSDNMHVHNASATEMRLRTPGSNFTTIGEPIPASSPTILILRLVSDSSAGGNPWRYYVNGVTGSMANLGGLAAPDFPNWYLFVNRVTNNFFTSTVNDLTLAEVLTYDVALTDGEVDDVASYWSTKFNIALA